MTPEERAEKIAGTYFHQSRTGFATMTKEVAQALREHGNEKLEALAVEADAAAAEAVFVTNTGTLEYQKGSRASYEWAAFKARALKDTDTGG